jgi:hypothetical protein
MTGFGFSPGGRAAKKRSTAAAAAAFDPSTLSPTGWWRAPFTASPWVGQAGGNLAEATNPPSVGAALNGFAPPDFDGTNDVLRHGNDWSTFVTGAAGSVLVLFNADVAAAAAADKYDDPSLVSDDNFGFSLGFSDGGVGIAYFDTAWVQPARIACSASAWHLAKARWSAGTLEHGVDSGAMTSTAAADLAFNAGSKLTVGSVAVSASAFFNGRIAEVFVKNAALSNADITNYLSYITARYGLSL